ncbi:hypothetical protein SPHINGO8AM_60075 [Sphingomonas sp. 8AM]|nr:hypothetical protein SPHINGO8AM_60075 [Sphingomonas sp. 8AM]
MFLYAFRRQGFAGARNVGLGLPSFASFVIPDLIRTPAIDPVPRRSGAPDQVRGEDRWGR